MPSSSQYLSADTADPVGGAPTTGAAWPRPPRPYSRVQPRPPVRVTNVLPGRVVVWTTTELCRKPLRRENPMVGPAGPRYVSEKKHASCVGVSRIAEHRWTPAQPP